MRRAMSLIGTKRTSRPVALMSAIGGKADIAEIAPRMSANDPKQTSAPNDEGPRKGGKNRYNFWF